MPPQKKKAHSASSSRNASATAKAKSSPYNRNAKDTSTGAKKTYTSLNKPTQARNKHRNMNLTSELDSLLGDLNSQLQRKKTKRDIRTTDPLGLSESEKKLNEAQAKHESLQQDMMSALNGISSLGN
ncbi:hypothetical protein FBU30_006331 [Linnemannia zychae]|nr:hypothetical protein FBU30_006331 [Linnemannia zychae]